MRLGRFFFESRATDSAGACSWHAAREQTCGQRRVTRSAGLDVCGASCAAPPHKGNMTECSALLAFGGPSSGTSIRRLSCGQRRVTRSWWNWLCDRYFAAILWSTARRLQLENARDPTLSERSLCTLTRSSSIVRSRVPLQIGRNPSSRQGCIDE